MEVSVEPLLSIILPVFNTGKYLGDCLSALVSQEGIYPYEVIAVDDASTDDSPQILEAFVANHPNLIRVIHRRENGGLCAARNDGLAAAKGTWVTFTDSDDLPHSDYVLTLVRAALTHDAADCACAGFDLMDAKGRIRKPRIKAFRGSLYPLAAAMKLLFDCSVRGYVWNKIFRRQMLLDNGIRFFDHRQGFEDLPFVFAAFLCSRQVSFVRKACYTYRYQRPGSLTRGGLGSWRLQDHVCSFFACRAFADAHIGIKAAIKMFRKARFRIFFSLLADIPSHSKKAGLDHPVKILNRAIKFLRRRELPVYGAPWETAVMEYVEPQSNFVSFNPRRSRHGK